MIMNYKVCNKCKVNLPATNEFFALHSRCRYGLATYCKKCQAQSQKERRLSDPIKEKEIRDRCYAKTKHISNAKRNWKYHNDPEFKAKRIAMDLRYRQSGARKKENRSEESWKKHVENTAKWRKKNPEKVLEYNRWYQEVKGDELIAIARKKRAELSDIYIRKVIQKALKDDGVCISRSEIPADFIELKRKQLNIYRDVKKKKAN